MSSELLTIHRRTIAITDAQSFEVKGYVRNILKAATVRNAALAETAVDLWYEVYPEAEHSPSCLVISIIGTGNPVPPTRIGMHIDTVITPAGLVWHVYGYTIDMSEGGDD